MNYLDIHGIIYQFYSPSRTLLFSLYVQRNNIYFVIKICHIKQKKNVGRLYRATRIRNELLFLLPGNIFIFPYSTFFQTQKVFNLYETIRKNINGSQYFFYYCCGYKIYTELHKCFIFHSFLINFMEHDIRKSQKRQYFRFF